MNNAAKKPVPSAKAGAKVREHPGNLQQADMNHVAHCFLSYPDDAVLFGNFIGDFVKGKSWQTYPPGVQQGILLHRAIDTFTDNHPVARESARRIREFAGRYAAPVVDILYDHLLILHWEVYAQGLPFDVFADWAYRHLDKRAPEMPAELQRRWPHMLAGRFLHGYGSRAGLEWVLGQFARRLNGQLDATGLCRLFFGGIAAFSADFHGFFPELAEHVRIKRSS